MASKTQLSSITRVAKRTDRGKDTRFEIAVLDKATRKPLGTITELWVAGERRRITAQTASGLTVEPGTTRARTAAAIRKAVS